MEVDSVYFKNTGYTFKIKNSTNCLARNVIYYHQKRPGLHSRASLFWEVGRSKTDMYLTLRRAGFAGRKTGQTEARIETTSVA